MELETDTTFIMLNGSTGPLDSDKCFIIYMRTDNIETHTACVHLCVVLFLSVMFLVSEEKGNAPVIQKKCYSPRKANYDHRG